MPWERRFSEKKKAEYLFNAETGESKWVVEGPPGAGAGTSDPASASTHDPAPSPMPAAPTTALPAGWEEFYSKSKARKYWYHAASKKSVWGRPQAPAASGASAGAEGCVDGDGEGLGAPSAKRRRGCGSGDAASADRSSAAHSKGPISTTEAPSSSSFSSSSAPQGTRVGIIVPFRDLHAEQKRSTHLRTFVPSMRTFLRGHDYRVYIVEQSNDGRKFNRGKLLNIGFDLAVKDGCSVFIFHDVDLIPSKELLTNYTSVPTAGPCHIASVWNRYNNNDKYFGGIVSFTRSQFEQINGFPNNFWGWGGEDDEMQKRVEAAQLTPTKPAAGSIRDLEEMSLAQKLKFLRDRREQKCGVKWEVLATHDTTWRVNGLKSLEYAVIQDAWLDADCATRSDGDSAGAHHAASGADRVVRKVTVDVRFNKDEFDAQCNLPVV